MVLDIELFRKEKGGDPDKIRENAKKRFDDVNAVEEVIRLDEAWRKSLFQLENINKAKNKVSKEIGIRKKQAREAAKKNQGDTPAVKEEDNKKSDDEILALADLFEHLGSISNETTLDQLSFYNKQIEKQKEHFAKEAEELANKRNEILREVGNLIHTETPISDNEDNNVVVRTFGDCSLGTKPDDKLKSHVDLILDIDGMDGEKGSAISGSRGYFLKGAGWFLKEALINYAVNFLVDREFNVLEPPFWMRKSIMGEVAQLNQFDEELYKVVSSKSNTEDSEEKYLIATSEQPIAALHREEWLSKEKLPIRYCGVSTCFRQEAGSHGRDTRGIFRVHQFDKIEQFILCSPTDSWTHFHSMVKNAEEFYQSLGIPYRIVNIVSGALNNAASMKYDLEAWFPGSKAFRELVSVSNCLDYQARRLGVRYGQTKKLTGPTDYVHMLNGTMCATTRTVCALLEVYQTDEGIKVPDVLKPYLPNKYKEIIPFTK